MKLERNRTTRAEFPASPTPKVSRSGRSFKGSGRAGCNAPLVFLIGLARMPISFETSGTQET